jgi:hypothetical protein
MQTPKDSKRPKSSKSDYWLLILVVILLVIGPAIWLQYRQTTRNKWEKEWALFHADNARFRKRVDSIYEAQQKQKQTFLSKIPKDSVGFMDSLISIDTARNHSLNITVSPFFLGDSSNGASSKKQTKFQKPKSANTPGKIEGIPFGVHMDSSHWLDPNRFWNTRLTGTLHENGTGYDGQIQTTTALRADSIPRQFIKGKPWVETVMFNDFLHIDKPCHSLDSEWVSEIPKYWDFPDTIYNACTIMASIVPEDRISTYNEVYVFDGWMKTYYSKDHFLREFMGKDRIRLSEKLVIWKVMGRSLRH